VKDTRILRAIGNIDDDLIERAAKTKTVKRVSFAPWLKWAVPAAACLIIAAVVAIPYFINNPGIASIGRDIVADNSDPAPADRGVIADNPDLAANSGGIAVGNADPATGSGGIVVGGEAGSGGGASAGGGAGGGGTTGELPGGAYVDSELMPATLESIHGLPTSSYTWDMGGGVELDRMDTSELRYLMRAFDDRYDPDVKAAFAIVQVEKAERFTEKYEAGDGQIAVPREGQIANCGVLFDVLGDGIDMPLKIKQYLYGGCASDEETNLLRVGGVYVLPLTNWQNEDYWIIFDDLDSLFEVDDKGLIQSHSRHQKLNKYDGRELAYLWKDIGYLYMNPILRSTFAEFISQGNDIAVDGTRITLHFLTYYDGEFGKEKHEWYGWEDSDAERFSAEIGTDGRIAIATHGFNVFSPVEGMTMEEMYSEIERIKRFVGLPTEAPAAIPASEPTEVMEATDGEYAAFSVLEAEPEN